MKKFYKRISNVDTTSMILLKEQNMIGVLFFYSSLFAADLVKAPIHIPIRGSLDMKDAKGTFFDHYVFQRATEHVTLAVVSDKQSYPSQDLKSYVTPLPFSIVHGVKFEGHVLPEVAMLTSVSGLLIIPGRERDKEYDKVREEHEKAILRKALLRGQPVLGICAGAWRVWQALHQLEFDPSFETVATEGLVAVTDHVSSRMMALSESNGQVGYNTQIHGVAIPKNTMLYGMMMRSKDLRLDPAQDVLDDDFYKGQIGLSLNTNSVHWKSPDIKYRPKNVRVVGKATKGTVSDIRNRHGFLMEPQKNVVEAFETKFGAPIVGIQWHPEAYNTTKYNEQDQDREYHLRILRWMAKAGDVYAQKQKVLQELKIFFGSDRRFDSHLYQVLPVVSAARQSRVMPMQASTGSTPILKVQQAVSTPPVQQAQPIRSVLTSVACPQFNPLARSSLEKAKIGDSILNMFNRGYSREDCLEKHGVTGHQHKALTKYLKERGW